jgi:hypothetical protein
LSLPGFTAERALGASRHSYRSRGGAALASAGAARPAIYIRPRQPQSRDVTNCTDCNGQPYTCALNEECGKICTTEMGFAWCDPK